MILSVKTIGRCGAACLLCYLDEEIGLVCWQLVHDMHATEIFGIQPSCKLSLFFMKMSELVWYFSTCEKLRAFERNQNLENSCLMSWR